MDKEQLIISMFKLANCLDDRGMIKEADEVDDIRDKINSTRNVINEQYDNPSSELPKQYVGNTDVLVNKYQNIADGKLNPYIKDEKGGLLTKLLRHTEVDKTLISKILQRNDKAKLLLEYERIAGDPQKGISVANKSLWQEVNKKV